MIFGLNVLDPRVLLQDLCLLGLPDRLAVAHSHRRSFARPDRLPDSKAFLQPLAMDHATGWQCLDSHRMDGDARWLECKCTCSSCEFSLPGGEGSLLMS